MTEYATLLYSMFSRNADPERALGMKAYTRNQFEYFGIPSPRRVALEKQFVRKHGLPARENINDSMKELWSLPERELQYYAMTAMYSLRKNSEAGDINIFKYCITHKSWWDTVDFIASKLVGTYCKKYPLQGNACIHEWITHKNMWLNRTAIIFQLGYKSQTDTGLLTRAIEAHIASGEFFLQKAIGWALRQYSYTNAQWVKSFIATHQLKPLSIREGMKAIVRDGL